MAKKAGTGRTFGEQLRDRRLEKGFSLRKFAKAIEVSPTYLSQVEQDKVTVPTADRVRKIAETLEESVDEWMALADRLPDELPDIIHSSPVIPDILRAVDGMTPDQLEKLRKAANRIRDKGKE